MQNRLYNNRRAFMRAILASSLLGISTLWVSHASAASEAMTRLNQFFTTVNTMQADFSQEVRNEKGKLLQNSNGTVTLYRPGRFRWEYRRPDRHVIVANGKKVWIYDEELDQVTIKPMQQTLASSPVGLLLNKQPVQKQFQVQEISSNGGLDRFHLIPHKKDSDFTSMDLSISAAGIQEMILQDKFGQETRIRLSNVQLDSPVSGSLFHFTPPAGVEVIGE